MTRIYKILILLVPILLAATSGLQFIVESGKNNNEKYIEDLTEVYKKAYTLNYDTANIENELIALDNYVWRMVDSNLMNETEGNYTIHQFLFTSYSRGQQVLAESGVDLYPAFKGNDDILDIITISDMIEIGFSYEHTDELMIYIASGDPDHVYVTQFDLEEIGTIISDQEDSLLTPFEIARTMLGSAIVFLSILLIFVTIEKEKLDKLMKSRK